MLLYYFARKQGLAIGSAELTYAISKGLSLTKRYHGDFGALATLFIGLSLMFGTVKCNY